MDKAEIKVLPKERLTEFSNFVFRSYRTTYQKLSGFRLTEANCQQMLEEDRIHFPHSVYYYIENDEGAIFSAGKVTKFTPALTFSIEKDFGILPSELAKYQPFHVGRIAIDHEKRPENMHGLEPLSMLYIALFKYIGEGAMVGECDMNAMRVYRKVLGMKVTELGKGVHYLGSLTYPAIVYNEEIKKFLQKSLWLPKECV